MRIGMAVSVVGIVVALAVSAPSRARACEAAGPFTHVGLVAAVDNAALTLTITDAQTRQPITFSVTAEQLAAVKPGEGVVIGFVEEEDGTLTAVHIRPS